MITSPSQKVEIVEPLDIEITSANQEIDKEEHDLIDKQHWPFSSEPNKLTVRKLNNRKCEILKCSKQAYGQCESKVHYFHLPFFPPIWSGCEKNLCQEHMAINYNYWWGQADEWLYANLSPWEGVEDDPRFQELWDRMEANKNQQAQRVRKLLAKYEIAELMAPLIEKPGPGESEQAAGSEQ